MQLVPVNQTSACMFAAMQRCIETPAEYTNTHLGHQLVKTFISYKEFFLPVLQEHIRGNYGHLWLSKTAYEKKYADGSITEVECQDYLSPGPFSFVSYLRALLDPSFWGDEMCLVGVSMMWQIGITVLDADALHAIHVGHNNVLRRADMVLVHCQMHHYIPAGERLNFLCVLGPLHYDHPLLHCDCPFLCHNQSPHLFRHLP